MRNQTPSRAASRTTILFITLYYKCKCTAAHIYSSYWIQYADVAAMLSVPAGMTNASIPTWNSRKKERSMEREIRQGIRDLLWNWKVLECLLQQKLSCRPGFTASKVTSTISPASVVYFSSNTRLNNPNRMRVNVCTKPWGFCAQNPHHMLDPSSVCACPWNHCCQSKSGVHLLFSSIQVDSKRSVKVRPSSRHTWALNDQVFDCLTPSWMLGSSTLDKTSNIAPLADNIWILRKKVAVGQYSSAFKTRKIVVASPCLTNHAKSNSDLR
jgi:hypothetical protein